MIRATPDHLDLVVSSLERSVPFYAELLGFGERSEIVGERGERVVYLKSPRRDGGPRMSLGLRERRSDVPHDRYGIGLHHVAFRAASRAEVDARAAWLRGRGATIESGPEDHPEYGSGYYAVFFYDPDGIKLEIMYEPDVA
jgi:glyoxylase I family protein